MRISIIIVGLLILISVIETKPVTHISLEDFFKEFPIESSTEKHYFRAPGWTGGGVAFVFKVNKPHPEFKMNIQTTRVSANSTDDEIVNAEKWSSWLSYSESYKGDDYDLYYYYTNFEIGYTGDVGIYFASSEDYKMTFKIKGNGYVFPISDTHETIVDDFIYTHYFKGNITNRDRIKEMLFVLKIYKPMETYDFRPTAWGTNETGMKYTLSSKCSLGSFKIKEGNDYMMFSYPFRCESNVKYLVVDLSSSQHYKIGCYLDFGN